MSMAASDHASQSQEAIKRLRDYVPPSTGWWSLPLGRRAAVLLLLYVDSHDELQVILTVRSGRLRNFAGHTALPGGKSDNLEETPIWIARREAHEEIGLPVPKRPADNTSFKDGCYVSEASKDIEGFPQTQGFPDSIEIEHLTEIPTNIAYTHVGVRPVVALLKDSAGIDREAKHADLLRRLNMQLDAQEVAAVFSAPLRWFLRANMVPEPVTRDEKPKSDWHDSKWVEFSGIPYLWHAFWVPVEDNKIIQPKDSNVDIQQILPKFDQSFPERSFNSDTLRIPVFGMTARILIDCARIAYNVDPEFEHQPHFGEEPLIAKAKELLSASEEKAMEKAHNEATNTAQSKSDDRKRKGQL